MVKIAVYRLICPFFAMKIWIISSQEKRAFNSNYLKLLDPNYKCMTTTGHNRRKNEDNPEFYRWMLNEP